MAGTETAPRQLAGTTRRSGRARAAAEMQRDVERPLRDTELFFSTTDEKGVITAGNRVFERVSGYALEDLVGRAHNIVRHPDMPRAVFRLLWDAISAGRPIAAYVRNRTADGAYYWVMASVVPIAGGYLSVRLAPGSEHFNAAEAIYAELIALEREIEGTDVSRRKPSIEASVARLNELLAAAGYEDYGAFMRAALPAEVLRRAERVPGTYYQDLARAPDGAPAEIIEVLSAYESMSAFLAALVTDLSRYAEVGAALADQASYLRTMGDDVRLFALNAQIGASRLGEHGAAIDAVARLLTEQSQATSPLVATVAEHAARAVLDIQDMTLQLSLSTIQAEMVAVFAQESCDDPEIQTDASRNLLALADALKRGADRTFSSLGAVSQQLAEVLEYIGNVRVGIDRLARLALNGRIELATVPTAGSISTLFSDVERQVRDARERLTEFGKIEQAARDLANAADNDAMHAARRLYETAKTLAA